MLEQEGGTLWKHVREQRKLLPVMRNKELKGIKGLEEYVFPLML